MSWSLGAITGRPDRVKERVNEYFTNILKNSFSDHEKKSVEIARDVIIHELDFMIENETFAVTVEGGGSACAKSGEIRTDMNRGSTQFKVRVEPVYGFLG